MLGGCELNYHKQSFSEVKLMKVYCMLIIQNNRGLFKSMTFKILPIYKIIFLEDHWFDTEGTIGEKNI